jgi:hypothetical protein
MPLVNARYPSINPDWARAGSPAGVFAESCPKLLAGGDLAIAASGVELSAMIPLMAGTLVTSVTFITGATAASGPTAGYVCLRGVSGALLAQTADFTTTARAANTEYTVNLQTAQLISAPGLYRIGVSFTVSTTMPTLRGVSLGNATVAATGTTIAVTHGSAVGGTAPSTTSSPSNASVVPYFRVS